MNTSEKIASAIKSILDEDRRADRERIAELERNAAILKRNLSQACKSVDELNDLVVDLNKQLDELTEKCAALVVERDQLEQARTDLLDEVGKRAGVIVALENELRESRRAFATAFGEQRERAFDKMAKPLVETPAVKRTPKVGDKVRIIVRTDLAKYGEVGEIGTVTQIDSGRTAWVDGVGVDGPWCHYIDNLEVIR